jgi:hypothetical protein
MTDAVAAAAAADEQGQRRNRKKREQLETPHVRVSPCLYTLAVVAPVVCSGGARLWVLIPT